MSHRQPANRSHDVVVKRTVEVEGTNDDPFDDGETVTETRYLQLVDDDGTVEPVEAEADATEIPITLNAGGSSYTRGDTGERVTETDSAVWPVGYFEPAEGDRIVSDGLGERLIEGVAPRYGQYGELGHYVIELGGT